MLKKKKWSRNYNEVYIELPFSEFWRTAVTESTGKELALYAVKRGFLTQLAQYSISIPPENVGKSKVFWRF